jgi:hypothetical protein
MNRDKDRDRVRANVAEISNEHEHENTNTILDRNEAYEAFGQPANTISACPGRAVRDTRAPSCCSPARPSIAASL